MALTLGMAAQSSWPGKTNEFIGTAVRSKSVLSQRVRREILGGGGDTGKQLWVLHLFLGGWASKVEEFCVCLSVCGLCFLKVLHI